MSMNIVFKKICIILIISFDFIHFFFYTIRNFNNNILESMFDLFPALELL